MSGHEHPAIYSTGRYGSWAGCRCGWKSERYRSRLGASLAWAMHVLDRAHRKAPKGASEVDR